MMRLYLATLPRITSFKDANVTMLPLPIRAQFESNVYYTPYLQMKGIDQELKSHMKFLKRKSRIETKDLRALTDRVVMSYVASYNEEHPEQPDCGFATNYRCEPSPYGGIADYLVYCNNHKSFVPILFETDSLNSAGTIAAALWNLRNQSDPSKDGYAIQTNGSLWQLAKVTRNMKLERTPILQPKNVFKRAYEDPQFAQMNMGLIEEGLQIPDIKKKALIAVYNYIDDKVGSLELREGEVKKKDPWVTRLLQRYVK